MISPLSGRNRRVKRLALELSLTTKGHDLPSMRRQEGSILKSFFLTRVPFPAPGSPAGILPLNPVRASILFFVS